MIKIIIIWAICLLAGLRLWSKLPFDKEDLDNP